MHRCFAVLVTILFVIIGGVNGAEARPDARRMTCNKAANLVKSRGAVVMTTGKNTFERIVASRNFCHSTQKMILRTKDSKRCFVGYICKGHMGGP